MSKPRRLALSLAAAGVLAAAVPLALAESALACCAVMETSTGVIDQAGERILFIQDGKNVTAHVQLQYYGDAKEFSWIVPIQALPTVGVGADEIFTQLREATKPDFNLTYRTEGKCKTDAPSSGSAKRSAGAPAPAANGAGIVADTGVTIVTQAAVGPYDYTVLQAEDPGSLRRWLSTNGYRIPGKLDGAMADYVNGKYYFVALKLQKDRETGDLQPIVLKYEADKPGLPIRLTSLSAVPDMDVFVWVLGRNRAVPDTYNHVEINEARIDWLREGNNYRQVVTEAMNEAGGKAFVTDYAGDAKKVKLGLEFQRRADLQADVLLDKTDALAFITTAQAMNLFADGNGAGLANNGNGNLGRDQGALWSYLGRHVKKPAAYADVANSTFFSTIVYGGPAQTGYKAGLAGMTVDTAAAVKDLQEGTIQPAKDIVAAFRDQPYLTQLYTTMSPDEMVEDPTFVFNADMEKVTNLHKAEAITVCSADVYEHEAPIKIKLASGDTFFAKGADEGDEEPMPRGGKGTTVKIPAARSFAKCGTVGRPKTIKDNQNAIVKLLSDLSSKGIALRINTAFGANPREGAGASIVITFPFAGQLAGAVAGVGDAAGGFGCAGCAQGTNAAPPPVKQGMGEGAAYALFGFGVLGYRRWIGRKRG